MVQMMQSTAFQNHVLPASLAINYHYAYKVMTGSAGLILCCFTLTFISSEPAP